MKKTIILFAVILSLVIASSVNAQIMRCIPEDGFMSGKTHSTDSTTFHEKYYFDIPEGCETDTLQLLVWAYSSDGAVHVKLYSHAAMRIAPAKSNVQRNGSRAETFYKRGPDSTALSTDHSIEGVTAYQIVLAAKDTVENDAAGGTAMKIWPDAVCIAVTGTTNNRADTHYALKLIGQRSDTPRR